MNLAHATIADARVQAFRHPLVAPPPLGFCGGPVLDDPALRHTRYHQPVDRLAADADFSERLDGHYLYAGPVYHHFGHFMAEMAHRFLPAQRAFGVDGQRWLMVGAQGGSTRLADYPAFVTDALWWFGIDPDDVTIVTRDVVVERLSVAEQGSDFGGGAKLGYVAALADHAPDMALFDLPTAARVYVSRRGIPGGGFLGERYLEDQLEGEGFHIYHPQDHGLVEQMAMYAGAETVVFPEGSACHGTEMLGLGMMGRTVLLSRRPSHREIFTRVLLPRSREFHVFDGASYLGSAWPAGEPSEHMGVSLFDPAALVAFMRACGVARLEGFDAAAYRDAARADLMQYVAGAEPGAARGLIEQFRVVMREAAVA